MQLEPVDGPTRVHPLRQDGRLYERVRRPAGGEAITRPRRPHRQGVLQAGHLRRDRHLSQQPVGHLSHVLPFQGLRKKR